MKDLRTPVGGRWADVQAKPYWDPAPADFPLAAAYLAQDCVRAFWAALSQQDEDALLTLMYPPSRERFGPGPIAGRVLAATGLSASDAGRMGLLDNVRVLPDDQWCFMGWPGDRIELIDAPTERQAWAVVVVWADDRWQIWGMEDPRVVRQAVVVRLPMEVDWGRAGRA